MKKIFYFIIITQIFLQNKLTFASENITWLPNNDLRNGNIHIDDIPHVILNAINFFIWIAWTISVIFIIIWAYKYLFGSLDNQTDKWKDTIFMAIIWFILSACAYLIVKFVIDNFAWK